MKVQVLDILKRLVKWDKKLQIYTNGEDNAYPERVDRLINNSVTAKMSLEIMIQYIIGKGYGEADNFKINDSQKLIEFATDLADDIAKNRGVFIHYDYNLNFEKTNPQILPFEKCRVGKKDSSDYNGKILFKKDWNDTKEKEVVFDVYNPREEVVKSQIENAGGIEKYKGQVQYINLDNNYYYPLSRIDSVMNDCDSESQAAIYKNMLLRKGFFGKQIIVTPPLIDNDLPEFIYNDLGVPTRNNEYYRRQTEADETKQTIESFIGAENAGGAMLIQLPDFQGSIDDIFKVITINSEVNDKMFEYTENSISKNILMAFNNLPVALVKSPDSAMFGNSGASLLEAKKMYWENTQKERDKVETILNDVVQNLASWNGGYLKTFDLLQDSKASLSNAQNGIQTLLQLQTEINNQNIQYENAVAIVEEIYGISNELARRMLGTPKLGIQPQTPLQS